MGNEPASFHWSFVTPKTILHCDGNSADMKLFMMNISLKLYAISKLTFFQNMRPGIEIQ